MGLSNSRFAAVGVAAAFILCGCGGGGGGSKDGGNPSNPPMTLSVMQNPITASVMQVDLPSSVGVTAIVSGTTTASIVYVVIVDAAGTFSGVPQILQVSPTQYEATLSLASNLTFGTHTGTLQISVCSNPQCTNVLAQTSAPYLINITQNPVLTGTWSRSSVEFSAVQGDEPVDWPLEFTTPLTTYIPYARFSDPDNVVRIAGDSQTIPATWGTKSVALTVSPDAPPGVHEGVLEMVYCRDDACTKRYQGITYLPYKVSVFALTDLKPLAPLAGAGDWQTLHGSSERTGYVPVTLDPAKFSPRWLWRSPDPENIGDVLEPVTAQGKVFTIAAPQPTAHITPVLFAIDESTGSVAWEQPLPDPSNEPTTMGLGPLMPPVIAGANVYVARTVDNRPNLLGRIFGFRVDTGEAHFEPHNIPETPGQFLDDFSWGRPGYMTPLADSIVLTIDSAGDNSHAFVELDPTTGASAALWDTCPAASDASRFAGALAADSNGQRYVVSDAGLVLPDTCKTIASPLPLQDGYGPTLVPGTSSVVVVGGGNLVAFDTATEQVKWTVAKSQTDVFVGSPVVVGTTIYVQNNGRVRLEARRESDGEVLWTWSPPWAHDTSLYGSILATDNLVFVATVRAVYAIDTITHQTTWMYPYPGKLAISANGVLYVRRGLGPPIGNALAAISLQ